MGTMFLKSAPRVKRASRNPGATPKKHARAILDAHCAVVQYATKALRWQFNRDARACDQCGRSDQRTPRTVAEDLLARSFDAIGVSPGAPVLLVQWSSVDGVAARLQKVERQFLAKLYTERGSETRDHCAGVLDVQVWGWVNGAGFRVWTWNWTLWGWTPCPKLLESPLLGPRRCRGDR